jgi:hypothetical protein
VCTFVRLRSSSNHHAWLLPLGRLGRSPAITAANNSWVSRDRPLNETCPVAAPHQLRCCDDVVSWIGAFDVGSKLIDGRIVVLLAGWLVAGWATMRRYGRGARHPSG